MPAFSVMFCRWIRTKELIRFMAYTTSGIPTGAFFTLMIGGVICDDSNYGWPYLFYISGGMGAVWCLLWLYLCFDLQFIPILVTNRSAYGSNYSKNKFPIPIWKILMSKPFWGYVTAGVACYWILAYNIMLLPLYIRMRFELEVEWNGLVSSFPNVLQSFLYLLTFTVSERILEMKVTSKTAVRRYFMCIGFSIFAASMVGLTFVECNQAVGVLVMILAIGASGLSFGPLTLIPVDMSPNFSGIISGMMNTIGTIVACFLPTMLGYLAEDQMNMGDWNRVFYASFFLTFICMILYMVCSSSELQPWNSPDEERQVIPGLTAPVSRRFSSILRGSTSRQQKGGSTESLTKRASSRKDLKKRRSIAPSSSSID